MIIGLKAALLGASMANSRFQYVKKFELADALLPDTYLVVRLDGHRFTRFTADHDFTKPNDERGLLLMAEVSVHDFYIICNMNQHSLAEKSNVCSNPIF